MYDVQLKVLSVAGCLNVENKFGLPSYHIRVRLDRRSSEQQRKHGARVFILKWAHWREHWT